MSWQPNKIKNHGFKSILCGVVMLTKTIEKEYWISHSYFAINFHPSSSGYCKFLMLDGSQWRTAVHTVYITIILGSLAILSSRLGFHNPSLNCLKILGIIPWPFFLMAEATSGVGFALYLLSLDQPGALGLVLIVSWTVSQITRGPRQPERKKGEGKEIQGYSFYSKQAEILETASPPPSLGVMWRGRYEVKQSTTDSTHESPTITAITKGIMDFMQQISTCALTSLAENMCGCKCHIKRHDKTRKESQRAPFGIRNYNNVFYQTNSWLVNLILFEFHAK